MIYALVSGLIIGAALTWLVHRDELKYLRAELATATDRLAHARLEHRAELPPRPIEPVEIPPLPPELQSIVDEWESPESRAAEEAKIRGWLNQGYGIPSVLRQYGVNT